MSTYCAGNTVNGNKYGDRAIFEGISDRRQEARISKYLYLTGIMLTNINKTTTMTIKQTNNCQYFNCFLYIYFLWNNCCCC
jgi:hypothetical protein